jgi:putative membrane protein
VALAVLYGLGCLRARRAGLTVGWLRPGLFGFGLVMLAAALLSPLHTASEGLLSAHMAQHTLLLLAPLFLIAGRAGTRTLQALPPQVRGALMRRVNRYKWLISHQVSLPLLGSVVVFWHLPVVFEPASTSPMWHAFEHLTLVAVAGLYWMAILGVGARRRSRYGASIGSIVILALVGGAIGGLMTFSRVPWYPDYAERATRLGVDWLIDQQLAGVLMWLPMGFVLMGVGAWLAYQWQADAVSSAPMDGADSIRPAVRARNVDAPS